MPLIQKGGITGVFDETAYTWRGLEMQFRLHLTNRLTRAVAGFTAEDTFGAIPTPPAS